MLKDGQLQFKIAIIDPNLDIFDNEYAEIKLHRYTSIKHHENINGQEA